MSRCITYFVPKGSKVPKTGVDVPIRAPLIIPSLSAGTQVIWALVGADGSVINTSSQVVDVTRLSTGIYTASWANDRIDENYVVSRYANDERFNNLRLGLQSQIKSKTLTSFIIEWRNNSNTLTDTYFSITIY